MLSKAKFSRQRILDWIAQTGLSASYNYCNCAY